jgi:hypothetical protein
VLVNEKVLYFKKMNEFYSERKLIGRFEMQMPLPGSVPGQKQF